MIETLEKLYKAVDEHRMAILAEAVLTMSEQRGHDYVWGQYWLDKEANDAVAFMVYQDSDDRIFRIYAYALKPAEGHPEGIADIAADIELWVADIKVEEE